MASGDTHEGTRRRRRGRDGAHLVCSSGKACVRPSRHHGHGTHAAAASVWLGSCVSVPHRVSVSLLCLSLPASSGLSGQQTCPCRRAGSRRAPQSTPCTPGQATTGQGTAAARGSGRVAERGQRAPCCCSLPRAAAPCPVPLLPAPCRCSLPRAAAPCPVPLLPAPCRCLPRAPCRSRLAVPRRLASCHARAPHVTVGAPNRHVSEGLKRRLARACHVTRCVRTPGAAAGIATTCALSEAPGPRTARAAGRLDAARTAAGPTAHGRHTVHVRRLRSYLRPGSMRAGSMRAGSMRAAARVSSQATLGLGTGGPAVLYPALE
jgi:hypothetical protein